MTNDLNFLKDSTLSLYFNFSGASDPFLLSLSEQIEDEYYQFKLGKRLSLLLILIYYLQLKTGKKK